MPEVIDGMRSPSAAPERSVHPAGPDPRHAPKAEPGEVVYQSRARNFVLQFKTQRDTVVDGQVIQGDNRKAVFRDWTFRTSDPYEIQKIEKYRGYGIDRDVWRVEDMVAASAKAEYDGFVNKIKANPELFERLRQDLAKADFDVLEAVVHANSKPGEYTDEQLERLTAPKS